MRVKMGYKGKSIPEQVERSRQIVIKMTGNANFITPNPTLASFTLAINALEVAYNNAKDGGKELKAIMRARQRELLAIVAKLAAYVQDESGGDEEIILSSGFDVVRRGLPLFIDQVRNVRAMAGIYAGSIHVIWDSATGAGAYIVEISTTGADGPFVQYKVVLQTRIDIKGLVPGALIWIRVIGVGRVDYGVASAVLPQSASAT